MKYCPKCGAELADEIVVCPQCGAILDDNLAKPEKQTNGMAIAGFVCSFFIPLLGWIFGGIGLARSKDKGSGKGFAIAALIISTVSFIYNLITVINAINVVLQGAV